MGEQIGEGHFGRVYACVDVWGNDLAAKVLKPMGSYEKDRSAAARELEKLVLLRHPNITYVHEAFEYRDTFYIITERCHGALTNLLMQKWFSGPDWLRPISRCLLQAVHYIHINGHVHQDIHPGNVFVTTAKNEMNPKDQSAIQFRLGDLGVAKLFSELGAANTRALWMLPPEVIDTAEFGPLDHRIDIYHCGLLLLQLANSGELRFNEQEVRDGKPKELAMQLQPPLSTALEKALRRHVKYRTATAMELWNDLSSSQPPVERPEQLPLPSQDEPDAPNS